MTSPGRERDWGQSLLTGCSQPLLSYQKTILGVIQEDRVRHSRHGSESVADPEVTEEEGEKLNHKVLEKNMRRFTEGLAPFGAALHSIKAIQSWEDP